jgi:hypothetical protein
MCLLHLNLNAWLAFTPCANATRATDAPGFKVCSTIRHFSPTGHHRLCGSLLTTARSEVSIYSPSGHSRRCPLQVIFYTHPHFVEMYRLDAYLNLLYPFRQNPVVHSIEASTHTSPRESISAPDSRTNSAK